MTCGHMHGSYISSVDSNLALIVQCMRYFLWFLVSGDVDHTFFEVKINTNVTSDSKNVDTNFGSSFFSLMTHNAIYRTAKF